ncbi:MAG TPA: PKD domain-containing protein, partial [Panacibacter sp.]|nr:PKD domain-containing protein [Panacibacter sp.]
MAQVCNTLGQRPSTAFPVCGIDTFSQTIVPTCDNKAIPVPGCSNAAYSDKNPFWYKFTCFTSGTFGFLITPTDLGDDYDWQIFDITGRSPDDVYTDVSLVVIGNWSGSSGPTGASSSGSFAIECASDPRVYENTFSKMPVLTEGHTYLLMVSHYTDSQIGYQLSFGGGTASITDPVDPAINTASASCDGLQITVKLSKKMKCSSLANDGSDFTIPGSAIKVISAIGIGCSNGFDMDSVVLKLSAPLLPGNYSLAAQKGADENTLLDNCNQSIAAGNAVPFVVYGRQPTPFDSIVPVQCAPQILELSFRKNIDCSSIDADGSDFQVTGPYPVIVLSASGNCADGVSSSIFIKLSSPVVHEGTYTITLFKGNDGNTIIDECGEETPSGATINFYVKDTVSANFTYDLFEGCRYDSIHFYHNGANAVNQWYWTFDGTQFTPDQNPHAIYNTFGDKSIKLWVSN